MRLAQVGLGSGGGLPGNNQPLLVGVRVLFSPPETPRRAAYLDPLGRSLKIVEKNPSAATASKKKQ